ncbi:thioredoxin reductase, partial [Perkinsus olseni]
DVVEGMLELTPVAIQSGKMLADRLFGGAYKLMDYHNVPTTVFTPIEYASVGISEENARDQYGDDLIVYHSFFKPLLWALNKERGDADCYMKVLCENKGDRKVVGVHILGPDAGEMIQGLAVAMKAGCTKAHLDGTVGIHPTCAETFTTLTQIKEDAGQDAAVGGDLQMEIIPVQHLVKEAMPTDTVPYSPPVNPEEFVRLAVGLLTVGLAFTCWLMMYNVTRTKFERSLTKELI